MTQKRPTARRPATPVRRSTASAKPARGRAAPRRTVPKGATATRAGSTRGRPIPRRSPSAARPRPTRRRIGGMLVGLLFVLSIFAAQLVRIQGFDSAAVSAQAIQGRTATQAIPAVRGTIYDGRGTVLAQSVERRVVAADQTAVPEYEKTIDGRLRTVGVAGAAKDLAPLLRIDEVTLRRALTGDSRYRILSKNVSPLTWRKIRALGIPGISSTRESERKYPQGTTAASLVGFVIDGGKPGGGVELWKDADLKGEAGTETYEIGQDGDRLPTGIHEVVDGRRGSDLRLTIDNDIQWYAQNALAKKVRETDALSGTVVVQRARTGEILALASYPTFDPNHVGSSSGRLDNLAFTDTFEPGSTAKVMLAAAAVEEGVVTPSTPMIIPPTLPRSDTSFRDSHPHGTLHLTFAGALAQSSNMGMILAGEKMSAKTLDDYYRRFGLGSPSGTGFPGETAGILTPVDEMNGTQRYTVMFGQGLSVTAVQAAGVFQTIANDGVRLPPTLVSASRAPGGEWVQAPRPTGVRVVSTKAARETNRMLEGVVSAEGTAPEARVPGYRVAGKTGTADRYDQASGGYAGKTASFIGFAPAEDPQLVVSVIIQRPVKGYYGGLVAGPVFRDVMTAALHREQIAPTPGTRSPRIRTVLPSAPSPNDPKVLRDRGNPDRG